MKIIICQEDNIRINKLLSQEGLCSRRQADRLIQTGKIKINLIKKNNELFVPAQLGDILSIGDKVSMTEDIKYKYVIEHKSLISQNFKDKTKSDFKNKKGGDVENIASNKKRNKAVEIDIRAGCIAIAPLDIEYSGLNIYTNDTNLIKKISDSNKLEYEYTVQVREHCSPNIVDRLTKKQLQVLDRDNLESSHDKKNSISTNKIIENNFTLDTGYKLCKRVSITGENKNILNIVLIEHKAHIIKRMLDAIHLNIVSVKRTRIGNINLRTISTSTPEELKPEQVSDLYKLL